MEIKIQSIHFDTTEKLQAFITKKAENQKKSYEDIQKVEVQLKVEKPATALNKPQVYQQQFLIIPCLWRKHVIPLKKELISVQMR